MFKALINSPVTLIYWTFLIGNHGARPPERNVVNGFSHGIKLVKVLLLFIVVCIEHAEVNAQSVLRSTVGSSGSSQLVISDGKPYFISQTIGQQSITGTAIRNGHTIRQGFQQPPYSLTIGDADNTSDLEALVFPNPFQQSIDILFSGEIEQPIQVMIHDIMGRLVLSKSHDAAQLLYLPLRHIANGTCLLHVAVGNRSFTRRIIKH